MALDSSGTALRDANGRTVTDLGLTLNKSVTLTGTGTVVTPLFHVVGTVQLLSIVGQVTTTLGANHTAAAWRLNDQTAQVNITLNTGVDISAAAVGSTIVKKGLAAAAAVFNNSSAGRVTEPTTLETIYFSPCVLTKKNGATTDIEYVFATTDNPTSGVMLFTVQYLPVSSDGALITI